MRQTNGRSYRTISVPSMENDVDTCSRRLLLLTIHLQAADHSENCRKPRAQGKDRIRQHLGRSVRGWECKQRTELTCSHDNFILEGILKHDGASKVNDLHDAVLVDDDVVELEISMSQAHAVQICHTAEDLECAARNLISGHLASHDDSKQVITAVLHDFKPGAFLMDDVNGLDDVAVMQGGSYTEFGRDFFVVVTLALIGVTGSELLDGESLAVGGSLHKSHRASSSRA